MRIGDELHQAVAHRLAHRVVDHLEALHVHAQHRHEHVVPVGPGQGLVEAVDEEGAAREVGERVVVHEVAEAILLASPNHLGDRAGREDRTRASAAGSRAQGLVVHHPEVAEGLALPVEERLAEEAHEVHLPERAYRGERGREGRRGNGRARGRRRSRPAYPRGKLDALLVLAILPGGDQPDPSVLGVGELGHEGKSHAEEIGHVADDGPEQLLTRQ